jgi:menaquinol-cytochrome c reductase iron-sulfur subunit
VGETPKEIPLIEPNRRSFHKIGSIVLGSIIGAILTIPGVGFILSPILKKSATEDSDSTSDGFQTLAKISDLQEGIPRVFPVLGKTKDAWVQYPEEPIGSVWLVKKGEKVEAFSAECPHLGCAVSLGPDGSSFFCPCHTSAFSLDGKPKNEVPPRAMDSLTVDLKKSPASDDPEIRVKFERFRTAIPEKSPLA